MTNLDTQKDMLPPPFPAEDRQRKLPIKVRKRARKACLSCRARKVRCDVSQRGRPCANCHLDDEPCIVTGRASKYRRAQYDVQDGIQASLPPYAPLPQHGATETDPNSASADQNDSPGDERNATLPNQPVDEPSDFHQRDIDPIDTQDHFVEDPENLAGSSGEQFSALEALPTPTDSHEVLNVDDLASFFLKPNYFSTSIPSQWPPSITTPGASEVSYCCYPFLRITNIHDIPQQDANYLEAQGCMRVPMRPYLDELVQQYFLHIQPFLPLLNEGDFWELYYHGPHQAPAEPMSLLLLQAMLFAACTFISDSTMGALGHRDIRSMRATFLRRTKLLYDMECESAPHVVAQACVLLSFTSLSSSRRPNTLWLGLAIENARLAEAHLYATMNSPSRLKERSVLKRIWWCCIIRDRSMGLLMRLPIRITKEQFDFDGDPLTSSDLEDEVQRSKVYNPSTKLKLAEILAYSIKLYVTLTDILSLILPPKGIQGITQLRQEESRTKLEECKTALGRWHTLTSSKIPRAGNYPSPGHLGTLPNASQSVNCDSIILYTNVMYMYYHTARMVLCHHEVLHLDILRAGAEPSYSLAKDLSTIFENRRELQDAAADINECHRELLRLGLIQWLPISAIGFILLPLVLNILDIKLAPPTKTDMAQSSGTTQQQLNILIQFMKVYWPRFDGIEWVSEIIRHIISLAQLDGSKVQRKSSSINWADIFAFQPRSYLRLVLALDLSLSKGRLPQDWDFPVKLRGLFAFNANPIKELVEGHCANTENLGDVGPSLRRESSRPTEMRSCDQFQHHVLGLDDCLIATLENQFPFSGTLGLLDVADSQSQDEAETLSDRSEGLVGEAGSSNGLKSVDRENAEFESCTARENNGEHGMEGDDTMGEEMTDGLMEAILGEDFGEGID
ncbi:hypothetical protein QQX98_010733 [Neonectria punicea]|uniref:Zn(2)-C6 fungal-type domain-containing protein n=1 Tax=Neonectria punicea TaxID=979145 RepID=A0ABR1GP91_9HYPO